jgi:hypothetical protein
LELFFGKQTDGDLDANLALVDGSACYHRHSFGADARYLKDRSGRSWCSGRMALIYSVGVLNGVFIESALRQAGCVEVYPGPALIYCCFDALLLGKRCT